MTVSSELAALLEEQKAYYRARAAEYDEWFYRRGRYDHGEALNAQWAHEAAQVRAVLHRIGTVDHALELACGTGIWTQELVKIAARVTALDASPEMIDINRAKLKSDRVTYQTVDLFNWQPETQADLVFMGFWLSHVPPGKLDAFLATARKSVRSDGLLFLIDSRADNTSTAGDNPIQMGTGHYQTRKLNDGSTFHIVKVFYEPAQLEAALRHAGFQPQVYLTERYFIYAEATAI